MSALRCVICGAPLGEGGIRVRYEGRIYAFDTLKCKRIFQENPDRYLDATGEVLEEPR
ncbi:MAG TPA: YHS domain-containing protein [Verrucomicrobiae bacterium]|nr:YHS domain-containing protein [Verrucomicrobiae bacterium]